MRVWEVASGRCERVLEGHTDSVWSVVWSPDGKRAMSGAFDRTVRVWEVASGRCERVLEGHTGRVLSVVWSLDGKRAFSGASNGVWREWDLSGLLVESPSPGGVPSPSARPAQVQYTNAKVLLVGETNAGKTGMTERLAHDRAPSTRTSTSGVWSTQYPLAGLPRESGWEREVWLWDFGGQADQRLVHQLYLDHTALVLLMFDAAKEAVLPELREWQRALSRSKAAQAPTFLIAGRKDVGCRFDREKVQKFAAENEYRYFETSAETNDGLPAMRQAMLETIPWDRLEARSSPVIFKRLKDEIVNLRDEGVVLVTFKELEARLRLRLPAGMPFTDAQLSAVVTLLDGPGVLKALDTGTHILLRPEWINIYAQAVIRTLRANDPALGCLAVSSIAQGKLLFQSRLDDGRVTDARRLPADAEKVVLQVMEAMLEERGLCLRQGGELIFPSYFGYERPVGPVRPKFFASYTIDGFLDDVYASLVVKLARCGAYQLKELWRDAADFETKGDGGVVGVKLRRLEDGRGELLAHHMKGVSQPEQVLFASYIHEHLREKTRKEVPRLRFYVCAHCDHPVKDRELALELLLKDGEDAKIVCQKCRTPVPLWDTMEKRFAGEGVKKKVAELVRRAMEITDTRRQGQLLVHEVSARIMSANQNCHEIPGDQDNGIDMVVDLTDDDGFPNGRHMYLQLKAGNAHLTKRKRDGAEVFKIKKQGWVKQWIQQDGPMMLVIGTFPEDSERRADRDKKSFEEVRWMEVGGLLKELSANGTKRVTQIGFKGERLDATSVRRWRERVLGSPATG